MKLLITGGAGFIGTPLCARLARRHDIICWDPGFFGYSFAEVDPITVVKKRVQELSREDMETMRPDWVLHLSGLSNDPMANFAPGLNWAENYDATVHVGQLTGERGIPLVFASSASVYGFSPGEALDETALVRPIGHYSESKAEAERWLIANHPRAVIYRQATVMGWSPRMRFDLLTNGMTKAAWVHRRLNVLFGGRETRAQVHVDDLVAAYEVAIEGAGLPAGVYNVASSNDQVMQLAEAIRDQLKDRRGEIELVITDEPRQHRSYALNADKLRGAGWRPIFDVPKTVAQLCDRIDATGVDVDDPRWYNIRWMQLMHEAQEVLARTGRIDVHSAAVAAGASPSAGSSNEGPANRP